MFPEYDPDLGKLDTIYSWSRLAIIVWILFGGFFVLLGAVARGQLTILLLLGIVIIIIGLVRNRVWGSAAIYENGVITRGWGKTKQFRFDELDGYLLGYRAEAQNTQMGFMGEHLANQGRERPFTYNFYKDKKRVLFLMAPAFIGWDKVGAHLVREISKHIFDETQAKFAAGESVKIDYLRPISKHTPCMLTLSANGIQINEDDLIPWSQLSLSVLNFDSPYLYFDIAKDLGYGRLSSMNGTLWEKFMRAQISAHQQQH